MALLTNAPRGTQDVLPSQSGRWKYLEKTAMETAALFGFKEIRTPVFEHTELFTRSVGDTTDVVQKEMYTFQDKGNRSITLRPEGTAGVVRAAIQNGLLGDALPVMASYVVSCFRYEKPQAGRLREFHQFGVEMLGAAAPSADAQVIALANEIFKVLGVEGLRLELNSIGCPQCRAAYHQKLVEYFNGYKDKLCETCLGRLEKNPMRILDCKNPECKEIAKNAPKIIDFLCDDCRDHFEGVKTRLTAMGIDFVVNPTIVRGLDYYTRTVFEFVSENIGAQGTVCGGGRYDGLIGMLGGKETPALGFAMGLERLLLLMDKTGCSFPEEPKCDIYIASMGEAASVKACELAMRLREEGFFAQCDSMNRSLKAQMKYADKIGARYTLVIGDNELETGVAKLKNMATSQQIDVSFGEDGLLTAIYEADKDETIQQIAESFGDLPLQNLL
ncbi:MAG: histidine--tRNA ligase [Candidatus Pararuminococcus gallinarum]